LSRKILPQVSAREVIDRVPILEIMVTLGFERPRRGTRTRCILHQGDGFSFSFSSAKGTWFCHRCNEGGGKIKLVQRALGLDARSALRWIAELGGIPLESWTNEERLEYGRRRKAAEHEAAEFLEWKNRMIEALREARDVYLQAYHRCRRFIVTNSLDHPRANDIATMCERYEERYQDLDRRIETIRNAQADALLSIFRNGMKRAA